MANYIKGIKRIIKKSVFGGIATRIGDIYSDPKSLALFRFRFAKNDSAILIGTPAHHNIGDHLLADNGIKFLHEKCGFSHVYEIPTRVYQHNRDFLKRVISSGIPIFITGGGWMGDIWTEDQEIIENIISDFRDNKIIILPQTVYYKDINNPRIERTKEIFSKGRSLTIFCRENNSFSIAKKLFENVNTNVYLAPDLGLYRFHDINSPKKGIGICLRNDREKITNDKAKEILSEYALSLGIPLVELSTININPIPLWKRKIIISKLVKRFSEFDVVVTDRLHGMIFSVVSGTKCIALDNKTHKVKGVYETWLSTCNVVKLVEDITALSLEAIEPEINQNLDDIMQLREELNASFEIMARCIRTIVT